MRLLTLAFTLLLVPACVPAAERLTLKASVLVGAARITLADVVTPDIPALTSIDLGAAPLPGYSMRLSKAEVARMLRSRGLGFELDGVDAVNVERRTQPYDQQHIVNAAQDYLHQLLARQAEHVELQLAATLPDLQLPAGRIALKPRPLMPESALRRRATVWVDVAVDGIFVRTVTVPFLIRAMRTVLVAKSDLPAGSQPDCTNLELREQDIAALDDAPVNADCNAVPGRLKRVLAQGAPLQRNQLQMARAVAQGDSVSLRMHDGAIMLEARATALDDGDIGQRIDVKPSAGTQAVRAEVIGAGLVKISY